MLFEMLLKLLCFIHLQVSLAENVHIATKNSLSGSTYFAETKIIAKLIVETQRNIVSVMHSDSEIVENFLQSHGLPITVDVSDLKTYVSHIKSRKIDATILHFELYDDFDIFYGSIRTDTYLYGAHFIIIYDSYNVREIGNIFSNLWKIYIFNVAVLVTNTNSPDLVPVFTYMPFINGSCGNTEAIRINEFNKTSMKWTTNVFFPKKFKQLNRCPLRFGCYSNRPSFIMTKNETGSTVEVGGMTVDIANMFSKILNFSINFMKYEADMGQIFPNKTATAMLKRVMENTVDIIFTSFQDDRSELLSATRMVYADRLGLVVPPPFLIDPMTKILLPFKLSTWLSVGMVAALACCTIMTLKFTPKIFHDYVIGSNVKGSMLNVWNIFLGGQMQILPVTSFPRFLLATLLIFTMIIRTLYQGSVFDLMKRDVHTVELKTIDEFIDHGFTFYIYGSLHAKLTGTKYLKRHEVISSDNTRKYTNMTLDPSFRGVVFKHIANTLYMNSITPKDLALRICAESLFMTSHGFYFPKNFYLVCEFDQLIDSFAAAGLIEHNMKRYVNVNLMKPIDKKSPSALTYGNIEGFFQLFYYGCGISIVSFISEIIHANAARTKLKTSI